MTIRCDYCRRPAQLIDSAPLYGGRSYGLVWHCEPCRAWVGVHKNSRMHVPLGRLANAQLRKWKMKAHAAFDPLWRDGPMTRHEAYVWMQTALGISKEAAHIGKFDVAQCQALVDKVDAYRTSALQPMKGEPA